MSLPEIEKHLGPDHDGSRALHPLLQAIRNGNLDEVKQNASAVAKGVEPMDSYGNSPVHFAVFCGNVEALELLLKAGCNPDQANQFGMTPLHLACKNGERTMVEMLLKAGADAQARDRYQDTPLHDAVQNDDEKIVRLLLEKLDTPDPIDQFGTTPLMRAAELGCVRVLDTLLERGADAARADKFGVTALHKAVAGGKTSAVRSLARKRAVINLPDMKGSTPLHLAAKNGDLEIARILISEGADPDLPDSQNMSAIHCAASCGHTEVQKLLARAPTPGESMGSVMREDLPPLPPLPDSPSDDGISFDRILTLESRHLKRLLQQIDYRDLVKALHQEPESVVRRYVKHLGGPEAEAFQDVARQGGVYSESEIQAARRRIIRKLRSLVEKGTIKLRFEKPANLDKSPSVDNKPVEPPASGGLIDSILGIFGAGETALIVELHTAVKGGSFYRTEKILNEHPHLLNVPDLAFYQETPLHKAARYGHLDIAQLLIQRGADVRVQNDMGITPLHKAAFWGHQAVAELLLDVGADPNARDQIGETPMKKAVEGKHPRIVELLKSRGGH